MGISCLNRERARESDARCSGRHALRLIEWRVSLVRLLVKPADGCERSLKRDGTRASSRRRRPARRVSGGRFGRLIATIAHLRLCNGCARLAARYESSALAAAEAVVEHERSAQQQQVEQREEQVSQRALCAQALATRVLRHVEVLVAHDLCSRQKRLAVQLYERHLKMDSIHCLTALHTYE